MASAVDDTVPAEGNATTASVRANFTTIASEITALQDALPSGDVVGTTDSQTLSGKSIDLANNTLTGTTAQFNTALSDGSFATLAGTETLTNKTLTSPDINGGTVDSAVIGGTTPAAGTFTTIDFTGANLAASNAAGPALLNEASSSTNPTLVPNKADPDTGIGWVSADLGALVAGGAEAARWNATGFGLGGVTPAYVLDIQKAGATAAQAVRVADSTPTEYLGIFNANNGGDAPNAANATLKVRGMATTTRSINAGGTVNASGADYAEYMTKAAGCGDIAKGDVCGVDANGKLTDRFDNAHSFVIKSTDPSYVGGDVWSKSGEVDDDGCEVLLEGDALEAARQNVDRIAFAGQVPCNITGAVAVGDYVVPQRADDGGIEAVCVGNPTLSQYMSAVGRVWKTGDALPTVAVKIS